MPLGFSQTSVDVLAPSRSVVTDMIMVQFIAMIVVLLSVLLFRGNDLSTEEASLFIIGVFASSIMLGSIYTRLTR
jgi:hypothetical protein